MASVFVKFATQVCGQKQNSQPHVFTAVLKIEVKALVRIKENNIEIQTPVLVARVHNAVLIT